MKSRLLPLLALLALAAPAFAASANRRPHAPTNEPPAAVSARSQKVAGPAQGERIVFIGNGLAERDVYYSRMETELHLRYPSEKLFVRNMGRPGDTAGFRPHPARVSQWAFPDAAQFHPELAMHNGKGFFPTPDQWLTHLQADTVVAFFGYNESFDGPMRVANFESELDAFAKHTLSKAYNGQVAPEMKLFGAAATSIGSRACEAGESKLQLKRSIPAASAAAASSGDFTWTCVRQRWPLSCLRS